MPNQELPEEVKKLPEEAQSAFRAAFNQAIEAGKSEQEAFQIAWSAARGTEGGRRKAEGSEPRFVVDLGAVALGEAAEGMVRIPLAMMGRWFKGALRFAITRDDLARLIENFRKRKADVVIDYEHASEFPQVAQGGPVPAAGWLKQIEDAPDERGILWGLAELTDKARELVKNLEYRYISPAIDWAFRDKQSGEQQGATLTSVALVNRPFLEAMPAVQLSDVGWTPESESQVPSPKSQIEEPSRERERAVPKEKAMSKTVITLSESGPAKVVCGECGKESTAPVEIPKAAEPKVIRLSDVKRDKEGRYDFASLPGENGTLVAGEVFQAQQAQGALDEAVKAGKILPAQRAHYEKLALSDLKGFRGLMETMKPQVDLSERGIAGRGDEGGAATELKRVDAQVDKLVGEKRAADKSLSYGQAYKLVLSENAELAQQRARLTR